jgi:hypothetical protein
MPQCAMEGRLFWQCPTPHALPLAFDYGPFFSKSLIHSVVASIGEVGTLYTIIIGSQFHEQWVLL